MTKRDVREDVSFFMFEVFILESISERQKETIAFLFKIGYN